MEENDDEVLYIIHDDEPDPLSMTEEDYFKANEEYLAKVRANSERRLKRIAKHNSQKQNV